MIDLHTHAFPPRTARKVCRSLEHRYGISPKGEGTVQDLLCCSQRAGLRQVVVHTVAATATQVVPANNWAVRLQSIDTRVSAFGTVHPGDVRFERELDRLEQAGIRGIKIHPHFQGFSLDDPGLSPIFECLSGRFAVLFHVGDPRSSGREMSSPHMLREIHRSFPDLTIIAAHLGGFFQWDDALDSLVGEDVYLDTSSSLPFLPDRTLAAIFSRHSSERILFGSDYPLFDPLEEIKRIRSRLKISDRRLDFLFNGAKSLLGESERSCVCKGKMF